MTDGFFEKTAATTDKTLPKIEPRVIKIQNPDLTKAQVDSFFKLIKKFEHIFAKHETDIGRTNLVEHKIDIQGHAPIRQLPYRVLFKQREGIRIIITESNSPWASPVVLVPKKNGPHRFGIDFRRLNSLTRRDLYPSSKFQDIFDTVSNATLFSTLYWQVPVSPEDQCKPAFVTHWGL